MLEGIALVAIVTAAITSTFVARATHLQGLAAAAEEQHEEARNQARYEDLAERLNRLETLLLEHGDR